MSASLAPRAPEGMAAGAAISVVAHLGLVVALALAVQWRLPASPPVAAELWSALPQSAAPPAPAPQAAPPTPPVPREEPPQPMAPPQPAAATAPAAAAEAERARQAAREAEIALEREARRKAEEERTARERAAREKATQEKAARAEQQRLERERAQQQKAEQADKARLQKAQQQKAEDAQLARQREENLRRLMGQIPPGTGSATGQAAADAAPSAAYAGRLVQAIFPNIVYTSTLPGNPAAVVEVRAGPNGTVIGRRLVTSSGHPDWDDAVLRAIDRTGILPRDADGRVPPVIHITFSPR